MKKILTVMSFLSVLANVQASEGEWFYNLECNSDSHVFEIIHNENPRNHSNGVFKTSLGNPPFGGVWFKIKENEGGILFKKVKLQSMNGGILSITKSVQLGRGGCTRAGCYEEQYNVLAEFKLEKEVSTYKCNEKDSF